MTIDRRRFLESGLAVCGAAGLAPSPIGASVAAAGQTATRPSGKSISRQFAQWVVGLRYEDLPAAVVDRVKGLTLHNLASALVGSQLPAGEQAVAFVTGEELGVKSGATILAMLTPSVFVFTRPTSSSICLGGSPGTAIRVAPVICRGIRRV